MFPEWTVPSSRQRANVIAQDTKQSGTPSVLNVKTAGITLSCPSFGRFNWPYRSWASGIVPEHNCGPLISERTGWPFPLRVSGGLSEHGNGSALNLLG